MDNGSVRWYNLDLPETIAVRHRFLREEGRVSMIPCSAMDPSWADRIAPAGEKVLLVIEGLSMYLAQQDIEQILSIIVARFHDAKIILEFMNPWGCGACEGEVHRGIPGQIHMGSNVRQGDCGALPCPTLGERCESGGGHEGTVPIYRVIGKVPALRNLSNKLAVLEICRNGE